MPSYLPRKLAYRILTAALEGHANELDHRSVDSARRRPESAAAAHEAPGRQNVAANAAAQARQLASWVSDPDRCRGADLSAEMVGLLCALALGHTYAVADARRLANELFEPGILAWVDWRDIPSILERIT